jgi:regulator of protease activity HflC (stomatin/prohibitin superfamily)
MMTMPTKYRVPPARRPNPITDDHSQPIAPPPRPPRGGGDGWLLALVIVLCVVLPLGFLLEGLDLGTASFGLDIGGVIMQYIIPIVLIVAVIALVARNVAIVPQANAYVVERLGKYKHTWNAGIHIKIPFVDRISNRVSLKEQVLDFEPQSVITKDNVSMKIDTVVYLVIFDPKLATYGVEHVIPAIENLTATTLRNLIGELTLDDTLTSRDTVNSQMQTLLDVATDPWGIKVNRVELKNIIPPRDIQEAMEKQMRAEREKREAVLKAEGSKQARILEATGLKEATVLQAEAAKQKAILEAQADREAAITRAEGQANAIRKVKEAEAQGIQMIKDAQADDSVIRLRSLATLEEMAKGQATTLIIPSDLAGLAGNLSALKAALDSGKKPEEK